MTSINFPNHYPAEQASFASCFETSGGKCEASLMTEVSNLPPPPLPCQARVTAPAGCVHFAYFVAIRSNSYHQQLHELSIFLL